MSSFDYLKTAIRQKGCTLQQVADASGMTKGYLSQLLNAKIKSPSAQKLEALHRFLGLEFPRQQKNIGVVPHISTVKCFVENICCESPIHCRIIQKLPLWDYLII